MKTWSFSSNSINSGQTAKICRLVLLCIYCWQRLITFGYSRIRVNILMRTLRYRSLYIEGWERKRSKCFTFIHLDLFHLSICTFTNVLIYCLINTIFMHCRFLKRNICLLFFRQVFTLPEYLQKRFGGQRLRIYLSVLAIILYVITKLAVSILKGR